MLIVFSFKEFSSEISICEFVYPQVGSFFSHSARVKIRDKPKIEIHTYIYIYIYMCVCVCEVFNNLHSLDLTGQRFSMSMTPFHSLA